MKSNPADIYDTPSNATRGRGVFYSPLSLNVDPMKRLLLINIERDPDTLYVGFEPQVFDDTTNGRGLMVIAYLKDGKVDIYHQPGLTLRRKKYDIVGKGLADLIERPMDGAHFDVAANGVDLQFSFADKLGRPIDVRIRETSARPRRPFSLLAPFPSGTEKPPALPLPLLYDFYFVRRSGTEIAVTIDGKSHKPDMLPAPIDGSWMYFVRYSSDPCILTWNEAYAGPLTPLQPWGAGPFEHRGIIYDLVENSGHLEISKIRPRHASHDVRFTFTPPLPDIVGLRDSAESNGRFAIWMEESMGQIEGVYEVRRSGGKVHMSLHPGAGWQPGVRKWSVQIIFLLARIFKTWPKTYRWTATIDLEQQSVVTMTSSWSRIAQKN